MNHCIFPLWLLSNFPRFDWTTTSIVARILTKLEDIDIGVNVFDYRLCLVFGHQKPKCDSQRSMYDLRQTKKLKPEGISLSAIIVDITPNSEYANFNFFPFQTNSNRIWDVKNWPKHQHNYAMCMSQAAHLRRYACSNQHSKKKKIEKDRKHVCARQKGVGILPGFITHIYNIIYRHNFISTHHNSRNRKTCSVIVGHYHLIVCHR